MQNRNRQNTILISLTDLLTIDELKVLSLRWRQSERSLTAAVRAA
ncbi:hypothetical protein Dip518_001445 [Parelusimicrobium proximum]